MIKLSANLSKKAPIPGRDFSSQQYGASMEIEVSDVADAAEIGEKLRQIYEVLEKSVDSQIESASKSGPVLEPPRRSLLGGNGDRQQNHADGNGSNGKGRGDGRASQAQIKAIFAISKDRGISRDELLQALQAEFGVALPDDLSIKQASDLIGRLQQMERIRR